jgi:hypothetical protein
LSPTAKADFHKNISFLYYSILYYDIQRSKRLYKIYGE